MKTKVVVTQKEDEPVEIAVLATSIRDIAQGFNRLQSSGLNRDAIITLLHRSCRATVSRDQINAILNCLSGLERDYLLPTKK